MNTVFLRSAPGPAALRFSVSIRGLDFCLNSCALCCKVKAMNPNWAEENLLTIRTLMERSALYRRALAPIMLVAGALGLLTAAAGLYFRIESPPAFAGLWFGAASAVIAEAFLLARRQALKDQEPFWSPPTRRVAQALLPPLLSGMFVSALLALWGANWAVNFPMVLVWLLFYGCALHSAGFFMTRGVKWFSWIFIVGAMGLALLMWFANWSPRLSTANLTMGVFFGALQLIYGTYLSLTEKKPSDA